MISYCTLFYYVIWCIVNCSSTYYIGVLYGCVKITIVKNVVISDSRRLTIQNSGDRIEWFWPKTLELISVYRRLTPYYFRFIQPTCKYFLRTIESLCTCLGFIFQTIFETKRSHAKERTTSRSYQPCRVPVHVLHCGDVFRTDSGCIGCILLYAGEIK
jgi:hypothetical protein